MTSERPRVLRAVIACTITLCVSTPAPMLASSASGQNASESDGSPQSRTNRQAERDERDESIGEAVLDALLHEDTLASFGLGVDVDDGQVTLHGVVDSERARSKATAVARSAAGVQSVVNTLLVRPQVTVPDPALEDAVGAALSRDPRVRAGDVVVTALDGEVSLHGTVETEAQKKSATSTASRVHGVRNVKNELEVEPENPVAETSDDDIRAALRKKLSTSSIDGLADVDILVEDGLATLAGSVPTEEAKRAAEELAFESGAVLVENRLDVREIE